MLRQHQVRWTKLAERPRVFRLEWRMRTLQVRQSHNNHSIERNRCNCPPPASVSYMIAARRKICFVYRYFCLKTRFELPRYAVEVAPFTPTQLCGACTIKDDVKGGMTRQ